MRTAISNFKNVSTFCLFLVFVFILSAGTKALSQELVIAVPTTDNPPFYYHEGGEVREISLDLAQGAAKKFGLRVEFKSVPLSRSIFLLERGRVDMIAHLIRGQVDIEKVELTTLPHVVETFHFTIRNDSNFTFDGNIEFFKNHRIGIVRGDEHLIYPLDKHNIEVFIVKNEMTLLRILKHGRIDVAIGSKAGLKFHADHLGIGKSIKFLTPPVSHQPISMGISKAYKNAKNFTLALSKHIHEKTASPEYRALLLENNVEPFSATQREHSELH